MKDAEYLVGFARESLGPEFYRGAPKLKLIQLISAGYDRLDIAAARQAQRTGHRPPKGARPTNWCRSP